MKWTSTNALRIGYAGRVQTPVILWIGLTPVSLSGDDGIVVARECREVLEKSNITNVEIRESVILR